MITSTHLTMTFKCCTSRSIYDPFPNTCGSGGDPAAAPGVCHRSAPEEGQRGSVAIDQSLPNWSWWVKVYWTLNFNIKICHLVALFADKCHHIANSWPFLQVLLPCSCRFWWACTTTPSWLGSCGISSTLFRILSRGASVPSMITAQVCLHLAR